MELARLSRYVFACGGVIPRYAWFPKPDLRLASLVLIDWAYTRYWDRIGITWEAYLRGETRGFRARYEPRVQSSIAQWKEWSYYLHLNATKLVSDNTKTCIIIGRPTEVYRYLSHTWYSVTSQTFVDDILFKEQCRQKVKNNQDLTNQNMKYKGKS